MWIVFGVIFAGAVQDMVIQFFSMRGPVRVPRPDRLGQHPKLIEKESQVRMVGYGAMLTESFVAVMAMIAASILGPGLYHAMNAPPGVVGATVQSASQAVTNLGFTISPDQLQAAAQQVQESTLIARTGGAPTLAVGMSTIFSGRSAATPSRRSGTTSRSCSRPCSS